MKLKIIGGSMWQSGSALRQPWRSIVRPFCVLAVLGLLLATTIVFWTPVFLWPSIVTISLCFAFLVFVVVTKSHDILTRVNKYREIDVEEVVSTLGFVLAIAIGLWIFGLRPSGWEQRARESSERSNGYQTVEAVKLPVL